MTLITYLSKVHFADGVLEVALSSEIELNKVSRPLLVTEQSAVDSEFSERVVAGLPFWCEFNTYEIPENANLETAKINLQKRLRDTNADVVIAYGSALALSVADASCRQFSKQTSLQNDHSSTSLKYFAIPGVDGLPTMSTERNHSSHAAHYAAGIQPTAVIIDPTLIMGESIERTSSAIADTLARCLSAHFSTGFNPPADGIALDGIKRILRNLTTLITEDSLEMRRELMAASLNGTLAMQKETGISHELCGILLRDQARPVCKGALMRLLILVEAELIERSWTQQRCKEVRVALGVPAGTGLRDWLTSIMENLPLPDSLSELGFSSRHIAEATEELSTGWAIVPSQEQLSAMLSGIKLRRQNLLPVSEII